MGTTRTKVMSVALCAACVPGAASAAPVLNPANNHSYEFIAGGFTWQEALAAAAARTFNGQQGYLVTITSQQESDFIFGNVTTAGFWMAGTDEAVEGQFRWAAGPEAGQLFSYARFASTEPNNNGNEDYVHTFGSSNLWNDANASGSGMVGGYVVEFGGLEVAGVPEPATWAMMIAGFASIGGALRRRPRRVALA
jgi:hypothetical protein